MPIKHLAISSPHSFQVRVLLQELYPDQGANLATALRRSDLANLDDYLQTFHKIGFDECGDLQLDEINFLFQTNYLPMSVFRGNSYDTECDGHILSDAASSSNEMVCSIPTPQSISEVLPCTRLQSCDSSSPPDTLWIEDTKANSFSTKLLPSENNSRTESISSNARSISILDTSVKTRHYSEKKKLSMSVLPLTKHVSESSPINAISATKCPVSISVTRDRDGSQDTPVCTGDQKGHIAPSTCNKCEKSTHSPSLNSEACASLSVESSDFSDPIPNNVSPWKPVLKPISTEISHPSLQNRLSSRQKLYQSMLENVKEKYKEETPYDDSCSSSNFDDSDAEYCQRPVAKLNPRDGMSVGELSSGFYASKSSSCAASLRTLPYCSSDGSSAADALYSAELSDSDCADRHIRDVDTMLHFGVPFTYDEVAYSTNEKFRHMKSRPGLTADQLTSMVNARRRATNRRAAERGRRMKSATRKNLMAQLENLRLQHTEISNTILRTRRRRQKMRDELTTVQQSLLEAIVGPDGDHLDPALWRLQTTPQGELVLVRVAGS